jgi:hypothetical protein
MIRSLIFAILTVMPCAVVACPAPAAAPSAQDEVTGLLGWIEEHSAYSATVAPPPEVVFCRTGEMITYEGSEVVVDVALRAAYDMQARRIFLVRPWRPDDPRGLATLVHELTHHLQFLSRDWDCVNAAELQAYRLQHLWLAEHGIESGFDWPQIRLMSLCRDDVHP